jgi:hypothetical protein
VDGTKNPSARVARALLLTATGAVALFNGTTLSPFFDSVAYILYLASRGYPLVNPVRLFYVTPLAIAAITLLIAGIPAALYERIRGLKASTVVSLGIWLVATVLLSLPTMMRSLSSD